MAAELLFTGQIAPDPTAGEDTGAQARSVLSRLAAALAERGLGLDDLLRLRLFVRDLDALPAIEAAIDARVGSQRPAMSAIEMPAAATEPGAAITLDAVAAPEARERRCLGPHSARLGSWVFLGAIAAADPQSVFAQMEEQLHQQGAGLRDVVKVEGWLTFPMSDYGPLGQTRSALVAEAGLLPASAAVQVGRVGRGDERLAFEAIAFVPEDRGREARHEATSRLADFYLDAHAAGGYVFTSGEVPDGRGTPAEQAGEIYERLRGHLAAHGATPADVLQQTVFVRAAARGTHSEAVTDDKVAKGSIVTVVNEAARAFYGADKPLPPTTLLPVTDCGFRPGCAVEIELVAATDVRRADGR
jgi:enamine deaminase RidA (YjgF/YER057c/UK114 family)